MPKLRPSPCVVPRSSSSSSRVSRAYLSHPGSSPPSTLPAISLCSLLPSTRFPQHNRKVRTAVTSLQELQSPGVQRGWALPLGHRTSPASMRGPADAPGTCVQRFPPVRVSGGDVKVLLLKGPPSCAPNVQSFGSRGKRRNGSGIWLTLFCFHPNNWHLLYFSSPLFVFIPEFQETEQCITFTFGPSAGSSRSILVGIKLVFLNRLF
ncbi:uncharacterized protein LOC120300187 [Crotalus tigris]|uniref:uncharacterized protein LOC120300187 n=1 Tax=Crotalus tigris TaxID=88082 RepID=UPI00192F19FA|nr:uncharacterized protein LOC120300187 [Crotalus tigris]